MAEEIDVEEAVKVEEEAVKDVEEDEDLKAEDAEEPTEEKGLRGLVFKIIKIALLLLLVIYILAALIIDFNRATFVFVVTILGIVFGLCYYLAVVKYPEKYDMAELAIIGFLEKAENDMKTGAAILFLMFVVMVILAGVSIRSAYNLISLFGLIVFILISWLISYKPGSVKWRPVIGSLFMQYVFGYIVIKTKWGVQVMDFCAKYAVVLLNFTYAGSGFVFGFLTDGSLFGRPFALASGDTYVLGPPLYTNVLPTVIFFSSFISVLYYIGLLPFIVKTIGYFLSMVLGTSASESLSAAGNIFVGQTEAPLIIKPFVKDMTESEIFAIMTGGFATIAGGVFGIYVSFGVDAGALLAASLMSAPAALAIAKITFPETELSKTDYRLKKSWTMPISEEKNIVHAASIGAIMGGQLMLNIAANLIAALAIIAMLDSWLLFLGGFVDIYLTFGSICEVIFYPFVWLMGVEPGDLRIAARLIGFKIFANEFVAYELLAFTFRDQLSARSYYILSYALCGFSNFGSIGIQIGGITPLAPNQEKSIARLCFSAMIAGNTACFMTACIAGLFYAVE